MYNPPTKCEVLITRKCNLNCSYCAITRDIIETTNWSEVPYKLKELGISFAPIYGAEPLMAYDNLRDFLRSCREVSIPTSVITNGVLLNRRKMEELKDCGLDSITISTDIAPIDLDTKLKKERAIGLLDECKSFFRDVEVICTITDRDWELLPQFITKMTQKGIWVHFDFYHTNKGQQGSKCAGIKSKMPSKERIVEISNAIISQKKQGYLIHASMEVLVGMTENPEQVYNQSWKCIGGSLVTLDTDGSIFGCDDAQPEYLRKRFPILEFNETWKWNDFIDTWREWLPKCPGCYWTTHIQSDYWWITKGEEWKKEIAHYQSAHVHPE